MASEENSKQSLNSVIIYYLVSFLVIAAYQFSNFYSDNYLTFIGLTGIWWVFTLAFVHAERKLLKPIFSSKIQLRLMAIILIVSVWSGIGIHYLVGFLNSLQPELHRVTFVFWQSDYPVLFSILFICLIPAFVEELAFRGFILGRLLKSTNPNTAIFISSVLFAIIHFSIFSLVWLIPLGMLFAYFRYKYGSIWYCILGYFAYNFMIISFEIW